MVAATDKQITSRDGRTLGYVEYGDPQGKPVLYCHGFPASRLEAKLTAEAAARTGVRVIAADRPGYGLSDFQPGRALLDWTDDATELADALDLERFAVLGVSGGGPYALACALNIPQRLSAVGIVGGLGPLDSAKLRKEMRWPARVSFSLARQKPWLVRLLFEGLLGPLLRRHPPFALILLTVAAPQADRVVLARPEVRQILIDSIGEAFRQGAQGATWELGLYARPWGFAPEEIAIPVHLWHGEKDATVPPSQGQHLAATLSDCRTTFLPDEGHFSLPVKHMAKILHTLAG